MQIFDYSSIASEDRDELIANFEDFFYRENLIVLFTNEHRTSQIRVSWSDARSIFNDGAWAQELKTLSLYINEATDNKMYEEAIMSIIYNKSTFAHFMSGVRRLTQFLQSEIDGEFKSEKNMWNIVYYVRPAS